MNNFASLAGRVGLVLVFILSAWSKVIGYAATQGYMEAAGVSGSLLPVVIALELLASLSIAAGFMTRWSALALAVFSVTAGFLFHGDLADQNQFTHLMKNVALAGGFLVLAANGAGAFSVDASLQRRRTA